MRVRLPPSVLPAEFRLTSLPAAGSVPVTVRSPRLRRGLPLARPSRSPALRSRAADLVSNFRFIIMQVPCCRGLAGLAAQAVKESSRKVPVKVVVVSLQGAVLQEDWVAA